MAARVIRNLIRKVSIFVWNIKKAVRV